MRGILTARWTRSKRSVNWDGVWIQLVCGPTLRIRHSLDCRATQTEYPFYTASVNLQVADPPMADAAVSQSRGVATRVGVALAVLVAVITVLLPTPEGLTPGGKNLIGVFAVALILWVTEGIPIAVTSLLVIVLQSAPADRDPGGRDRRLHDAGVLLRPRRCSASRRSWWTAAWPDASRWRC